MARCRRSMKPDLTLPPLGSSIVAVTRPYRNPQCEVNHTHSPRRDAKVHG
jgi:hypothetical protein